ncbi:unnamed protein product, partial [Phytomonas sp. Hart1]
MTLSFKKSPVLVRRLIFVLLLSSLIVLLTQTTFHPPPTPRPTPPLTPNDPINNWVVILGGARYYFNYRHTLNALGVYNLVRSHGIDDDHILFFFSDGTPCDPRNPHAGALKVQFEDYPNILNWYDPCTRVDFFATNVDVPAFLHTLQGRYDATTAETRRLRTDAHSNLLIYLTGHSAKGYFKFQDAKYLSGTDLSEALSMMHTQGRYRKVLLLVDTCKALELCRTITAPNVVCLASSDADKDSFSGHYDRRLGIAAVSRWTYELFKVLEGGSCAEPARGAAGGLYQSIYDFAYHPLRQKLKGGAPSEPAHKDAVNDKGAIHRWTMAEFLCPHKPLPVPIEVRYDLF